MSWTEMKEKFENSWKGFNLRVWLFDNYHLVGFIALMLLLTLAAVWGVSQ